MLKYLSSFLVTLTITMAVIFSSPAHANTSHTVQNGDTFWNLGVKYGVAVQAIKKLNNRQSDLIYVGERLNIPPTISAADHDLLARLVSAEAVGEPYAGKVAVATVVLNRIDNPQFPNSIRDVIYEKSASGHYAFSPVANGQINKTADSESIHAVNEALAFRGQGNGSIYFYNPKTATNEWIKTRPVTITIENHVFAR